MSKEFLVVEGRVHDVAVCSTQGRCAECLDRSWCPHGLDSSPSPTAESSPGEILGQPREVSETESKE